MTLASREIILGVSGGVSAYKSAELLRRLQDVGFLVTVIPTQASLNFVGLATWEALSGRPVESNLWNNIHDVPHIKLAKKAAGIVIAPATADIIAKMASGLADDLLTNVLLASAAPKIIIPAMHPEMWSNLATQKNVQTLRERGFLVIEPEEGRMTGDDQGVGRYPEVSSLIEKILNFFEVRSPLLGKNIVISAGGTREPIDPIRYIGNRSSGKQGIAIAEIAASLGARVTLIIANSSEPIPTGITVVTVETAEQMGRALSSEFAKADVLFMTAAVADARPVISSKEKIKKSELKSIELIENLDILSGLSKQKKNQIIVAFAAETIDNAVIEGERKRIAKGADLLYLNNVSEGAIFGSDLTTGIILDSDGTSSKFDEANKDTLALELLNRVISKLG